MPKLTKKEKIWIALEVIQEARKMAEDDKQVAIAPYKYENAGLDYEDWRILIWQFEKGGISKKVKAQWYKSGDGKPLLVPQEVLDEDVNYERTYLEIQTKKFNDYYAKVKKLTKKTISKEGKELLFNEKEGIIIFGDRKCKIPYDTLQWCVCKKMFDRPILEPVSWDEILDECSGHTIVSDIPDKKDARKIYDAVRAINGKVKGRLKIKKLLEFKRKTVRRLK